jgi:hypothetical protein
LGLEIVSDEISPGENRRAQNQWTWQTKKARGEIEQTKEIAQQITKEDVMKEQERCDSVMSVAVSIV